jgi:hypothetical protein
MTQTIEIPLPEELVRLVDAKAQSAGLKREAYIRAVLSRDVMGAPSISEALFPFRDQVASSGITDGELEQLFNEAREESYRDRLPRRTDGR